MPKFDIVPIEEVRAKTPSGGKTAQILQEYRGYIDQLTKGEAGRLVAAAGETTATVRRRIGAEYGRPGRTSQSGGLGMRSTSGQRGAGQGTGGAGRRALTAATRRGASGAQNAHREQDHDCPAHPGQGWGRTVT